MTGRLEGKVALVSGAARGQGRSHALRLAEEGAEIIAFDLLDEVDSVLYPLATQEDLDETVNEVEKLDRRIVAGQADVRDLAAVQGIVDEGVAQFGRLDVVCANAGIVSMAENAWTLSEEAWDDMIGINLTGVWKTCRAAIPAMLEAGNGGSIAITSSTAGIRGMAGIAHYASAKHGVVGLARTLAHELAPHHIRVNTVHPTAVDTPMVNNEITAAWIEEQEGAAANIENLLPVSIIEAVDISNAIVWLASDEARYVTGVSLPVDAGFTQK